MDPGYRENKNSKVSLPWNMILLLPVNIDKKNDIMFFQAWSRIKLTNPMVVHIVWLMAAEIGFFLLALVEIVQVPLALLMLLKLGKKWELLLYSS